MIDSIRSFFVYTGRKIYRFVLHIYWIIRRINVSYLSSWVRTEIVKFVKREWSNEEKKNERTKARSNASYARAEKRHELSGQANISEIQVHIYPKQTWDLVAKAISNKILRSNVPVVSTFTKGNVAILIYVEYLSVSRHDSMRTFYKIGVSIYREIESALGAISSRFDLTRAVPVKRRFYMEDCEKGTRGTDSRTSWNLKRAMTSEKFTRY